MSHTGTRYAWFRLNADGVLVACLGLAAGLDVFHPHATQLATKLGYIPPGFFAWTLLYFMGAMFMLQAFVKHSLGIELLGRFFLISAAIWETWRMATVFGADNPEVLIRYFLILALVLTAALRGTALLSKHGVAIVIPSRTDRWK